ncbi:hypothetical protein ANCCAN_18043 [Ancylostoma caninum]|uniref:NTR domain-containing protein n=1 Tax=Ancylostoma caninum TaxID=29170 RepID=A0A368FV50_ANCCA|nr:hypothetical protein ANCCAN_18043 [Ancylostoma caninum]
MNVLVILSFFLAFIITTEGCTCQPRSISVADLCTYDYGQRNSKNPYFIRDPWEAQQHSIRFLAVSRSTVKSISAVGEANTGYKLYEVKHGKIFLNKTNFTLPNTIRTPALENLCGASLEMDMYLLTGKIDQHGQAWISLCNINKLWEKVTKSERKILKDLKC